MGPNGPSMLTLLVLALVGLFAGSLINAAIYAWAWHPRPISPWQRPHPNAPPRRWTDRLPVIGWLGLRREAFLHGRAFWVRPLCLELVCGLGLPALYAWEVGGHLTPPLPLVGLMPPGPQMLRHLVVAHSLLAGLMLIATFIDFDEKTIPDEVTIPGTLAGLLLAVIWPDVHLPVLQSVGEGQWAYQPLRLVSDGTWPAWLRAWPGLAIGLAIYGGWCAALVPAVATLRRGWWKAVQYYLASGWRWGGWRRAALWGLVGTAGIVGVWGLWPDRWPALLTALVGLGVGGGMVWAVRVAGWLALRQEAMGFGDVTLMAMIGSFLGWQASLLVFFFSPFAALGIAVGQWVLTGRRDLPYGPYLCAAALGVILAWPWCWRTFGELFVVGWLLPATLAVCLALLVGGLTAWRAVREALGG
jgi:leader peptidase (prepilin peptidase)/N-methyltransferase